MFFINRNDAGKKLAAEVAHYKDQPVVVYGVIRGGVGLAVEVARSLNAPLDVLIPRRIARPFQPAFAADTVVNRSRIILGSDAAGDPNWLEAEVIRQHHEGTTWREAYLAGREPIPVEGKTAILLDDGIATGFTMKLAIQEVRERSPRRVVVAVPVIPHEAHQWLCQEVDEVVALEVPGQFATAVAEYFEDFRAVEEDEVLQVMRECAAR